MNDAASSETPRRGQRLTHLSRSMAGQVIIVTGAASGMGRATAHLLADEGASVGVIDRDAAGLDSVVKEIESVGGRAVAAVADVTDAQGLEVGVRHLRAALGPIDGLVNNAGLGTWSPIQAPEFIADWNRTIDVNLTAYALMVRLCLDDLGRAGAGRVVNIASTSGLGAPAGSYAPYTVSKHGVVGLTRALAVELGPLGITVNCVCPGPIHTGMTDAIEEADKVRFAKRRTALLRYGDPEEVAHGTLSFLIPAAAYMTGSVLAVDGGLTARNG